VINARFAKPIDEELLLRQVRGVPLVVTLEESALAGGFGSAVLETLADAGRSDAAYRQVAVTRIGIPAGRFVDHGSVSDLRHQVRLDADGILGQVREAISQVGIAPSDPLAPSAARSA
jgi:1-deoxy-D-xylulose-5-phosphate synthase